MKRIDLKMTAFTTALVGVGLFTAASANAEGSAEKFLTDAMQGNLTEVNMGKLAEQNSDNAAVKSFGTELRRDHSAAYRASSTTAARMGVPVVSEPTKKQQDMYQQMQVLHGAEFDNAFIEAMIRDHKKDISMYESEAKRSNDGAAAQYAANTLPTLRKHLKDAEALAR